MSTPVSQGVVIPTAFDFTASPFDCLDAEEQRIVRDSVDIAYFREGETILDPGVEPSHLYVVMKGYAGQYDRDEQVATYGPSDCFDGRALVAGRASSRFVAMEELLAYQLPKTAVNLLISRNVTFGALLFSDLSNKLAALAQRHAQREMHALTAARVEQAFLRSPHMVKGSTDIRHVVEIMQAERTNSVLVQDGERLGILTSTGLQRAILDGRPLSSLPVRDIATFELVSIAPDAPLFDALALMIRHQVHRLVVMSPTRVVGTLEQLDLLSYLSNHSYVITVEIVQARDLAALRAAAEKITHFVALLHRGGTRVGQIGQLVQALHDKLFERAWQLIASATLQAASCLFVMGSEGRGEQLLKTDQDNGLVLRDDASLPAQEVADACERFSAALRDFGYPDCPGGIMVSNPMWREPVANFKSMVRRWLMQPEPEGLMALAIFLDANAVTGDASLLAQVRAEIDALVSENDALLANFARAIDAFPEVTGGWWNRLLTGDSNNKGVDIKKVGIFPIVHGVRSLALRDRVAAISTVDRLDALVAGNRLSREFATDLGDSLHFMMGLKLDAGLAQIETGRAVTGIVATDRLSSLERDLLKDALAVVKRFKTLVRHQFHLEAG